MGQSREILRREDRLMHVALARRQIVRRRFLHLAGGAAALPITAHLAKAEAFPARPVHIVVGFPPGSVGDIAARLIAPLLQQRLGQSVVVDNRPGVGGNVGTEAVVRAAPDGYTLIQAGGKDAISGTLYSNLPFDFIRDIAMVAGLMHGPLVMAVNPSLQAKDLTEFIAYAKANPGKINMASGGNGTSSHLAGELFMMMAGVAMVHVPYQGALALPDLVAGRVQVMFDDVPSAIGFIRDGRLRALAVTTAARWPALPEVPPVADAVPGYEVSGWRGLGAPKATPAAIITKLNNETNASLADRALVARMAELGAAPMVFSPSELDAFVAAETDKWAKVVKFSGAKID
jgi:tripartite-type tricarboxylate transporter receptor subunit TctC